MGACILEFSKNFTQGLLKGITLKEEVHFVSGEAAVEWVDGVLRSAKAGELDYDLVDFTNPAL